MLSSAVTTDTKTADNILYFQFESLPCRLFSLFSHCTALLQVIGYSSNLTVFISPDTVGTYTCLVAVRGYKHIQASGQLYQRGPPVIVGGRGGSGGRGGVGGGRVQYGSLGDTLEVVCEARAEPQVDTVSWRYQDRPVNTGSQRYHVTTKKKADRVSSSLVIRNIALADFGVYNCSLRNSYGQDFSLIEIVRKGKC